MPNAISSEHWTLISVSLPCTQLTYPNTYCAVIFLISPSVFFIPGYWRCLVPDVCPQLAPVCVYTTHAKVIFKALIVHMQCATIPVWQRRHDSTSILLRQQHISVGEKIRFFVYKYTWVFHLLVFVSLSICTSNVIGCEDAAFKKKKYMCTSIHHNLQGVLNLRLFLWHDVTRFPLWLRTPKMYISTWRKSTNEI